MRIRPITPEPNTPGSTRHIENPRRLPHLRAFREKRSKRFHNDGWTRGVGHEGGCHAGGERGGGGFFAGYGGVVYEGVDAARDIISII